MLRDLIYEKVLVGPVTTFDHDVCRLIELPTGGARIEHWVKNVGWTEAPPGYITPDKFVAGGHRPTSAKDAARLDIPASELDDVTPFEIELAKHEMSRRPGAKIVGALKNRAWTLACRWMTPGNG